MKSITQQLPPQAATDGQHPLIRLTRVSRSFAEAGQQHIVLHNMTATFAQGEIIAIMGRSGSGKSTLLNLLSGIDTPDSGEIWIRDRSLTTLSEQERTLFRRSTIGFVFQFFNLVQTLTVLENVLLPLELNGQTGRQAQQRAMEMLAHVGLAERGSSYPDRLSGGEQQRVALARALVHNPPLLLADEPTGNLDSDTSQHILDLLHNLTRQAGKSMVMVTHSLETAGIADRIFRLQEGSLVEDSTHQRGW